MQPVGIGGWLEQVWVVWSLRGFAVFLLGAVSYAALYALQEYFRIEELKVENEMLDKDAAIERARADVKIEEIKAQAQIAIAEMNRKQERPIIVNKKGAGPSSQNIIDPPRATRKPVQKDSIVTHEGDIISQDKVREFVRLGLNGMGLGIGKWKSEKKWMQNDVETVLDYLAHLGLVTPRKNGIACEWVGEVNVGKALERIYSDQESKPRLPALPRSNMPQNSAYGKV